MAARREQVSRAHRWRRRRSRRGRSAEVETGKQLTQSGGPKTAAPSSKQALTEVTQLTQVVRQPISRPVRHVVVVKHTLHSHHRMIDVALVECAVVDPGLKFVDFLASPVDSKMVARARNRVIRNPLQIAAQPVEHRRLLVALLLAITVLVRPIAVLILSGQSQSAKEEP